MDLQFELRQAPFVRICLLFISGIFIGRLSGVNYLKTGIVISVVFFILLLLLVIIFKKKLYSGLLICLIIFFSGYLEYFQHITKTLLPETSVEYNGIITGHMMRKEKTYQTECRLFRSDDKIFCRMMNGKVRLYLAPDSLEKLPEIGDSIRFTASFTPIRNAGIQKSLILPDMFHTTIFTIPHS
jgi:hypothetical protein